jgi:hypothetical protein
LRTMALDALEFIRRFLQHVLPTGFMKIRYYGFLNPNCSVPLEKISTLIQMAYAFSLEFPVYPESPPKTPICPNCGGTLWGGCRSHNFNKILELPSCLQHLHSHF